MKRRLTNKAIAAAAAAVVLIAALMAVRFYNQQRLNVEKQTRFMMDTFVTIYAVGPRETALSAMKAAFEKMQALAVKFDHLDPEGPVYAFNHHGAPISDPEVLHVVGRALTISQLTDGAFDITVAPLIELWGFYGGAPVLPDPSAIQACLGHIGYRHLKLKNNVLVKDNPAVRIDLGGIAKGYCLGQAVAVLKNHGVASALIDAGGDVYALGKKAGSLWKIGVRSPRGDGIIGFMEVEDLAVMGSGDYERFFIHNQKRYHHIFDPRTGYPVEGLSGATLVHADPMLADAWNTAIFVLGPEKGRALAEEISGMEALLVTDGGELLYTSGLAGAFKENTRNHLSLARRKE